MVLFGNIFENYNRKCPIEYVYRFPLVIVKCGTYNVFSSLQTQIMEKLKFTKCAKKGVNSVFRKKIK